MNRQIADFFSTTNQRNYLLCRGDAAEALKEFPAQAVNCCITSPHHKRGTKPGDVWQIIPEDEWRKDAHFAVFPKELCEIPIKATCPPGGILIDPFVGTGTAIIAAMELNRRGIGIDISHEYLGIAQKRIEAFIQECEHHTEQLSLF